MKTAERHILVLVVVFVAVIAVVVIVILNLDAFNPNIGDDVIIEDGDSAMIHYKLWIAESEGNDVDIDWVDVTPDQENTFLPTITKGDSSGGLIPGFYNALLGMKENETNRFFLDANIDDNGDGIDDITGKDVVSYTGSHDLANTRLLFWLEVLDIVKKGDTYTGTLPTSPASASQIYTIIQTRNHYLDYLTY